LRQRAIPRSSRTRLPATPADSRESPHEAAWNLLLAQGILADPRPARQHQDRPVTPEVVAGSSPGASVKIPANRHLVLSLGRQIRPDYTDFSPPSLKRAKPPETGQPGIDSKPIQIPFRVTASTARNYTKWPEVKAPAAVAVECRKSRLGRRQGAD
jgi:hypothetical protein